MPLCAASLLLALHLGVAAAPADDGWGTPVVQKPALQVWTRQRSGSKVHELRAERLIAASPECVWQVINAVDHYSEFMPHVAESRLLATTPTRRFEYFRIDPPVIKMRDYTVQTTLYENKQARRYERHWQAANHQGPPPRADSVRLSLCDGSWVVQGQGNGKSKLTYWVYTDPAGSIPAWLANRVGKNSVPAMLDAVAHRAQARQAAL